MNKNALSTFFAAAVSFTTLFAARDAAAVPEAHVIRIDPRAGLNAGTPILTTVVDVIQFNSFNDALMPCAPLTNFQQRMSCISDQVENSKLWSPLDFYPKNAIFTAKVAGSAVPATLEGTPARWGQLQNEKLVGTAWVIALDASAGMGARFADARQIAWEFLNSITKRPNDLVNLQIFDDQQVIARSGWKPMAKVGEALGTLNNQKGTAPSRGSDKPLLSILKAVTVDSFNTLGATQDTYAVPMHQALVVLSNGAGRNDASSAAPSAEVFRQFATKGRFPEENTAAPKTPLPVISVWFPNGGGLTNSTLRNNDSQFMQSLANPEIGGFFDVVQEGQGGKSAAIVGAVRKRFDNMYVAKWRISCLEPATEQSFSLQYMNVAGNGIKGDSTFQNIPIGIDPSRWPLDVDVAKTKAEADANPVRPGGELKVYGRFCWAGDAKRAEAYYIPAGTKSDPNMASPDIATVLRAQQDLVAQNMRGAGKEVGDGFAVFHVPEEDKVLEGSGDQAVVRVLIYDNVAKRASSRDAATILTVKGGSKAFNPLVLGGIAVGAVVVILLVVLLMRGGGKGGKGKRSGTPPPQPVVAGGYPQQGYGPSQGGYGTPPPGGYGGPPQGGGYGGGYGGPPQGGGY